MRAGDSAKRFTSAPLRVALDSPLVNTAAVLDWSCTHGSPWRGDGRTGVTSARGYNYAEATAGGVDLDEINPATMESRTCPGLFLVGEILDVDGRIGGFNFQWAWASGRVAGGAVGDAGRPGAVLTGVTIANVSGSYGTTP